jgi:chromosome segregation ATPase
MTFTLLNQKSEEISKLETELEHSRIVMQALNDDNIRIKDSLASMTASADDVKQQLTDSQTQLTGLKEKYEADVAGWSVERDVLVTSVDTLTRSKTSLESDVTFFQTQYTQASAYTSSIQEQNKELILRADIADSQVKEGLAMVNGFFELRVKKLEEEVGKWKGRCGLLQEKDDRTGDDIRRRAGEERELRLRVVELEAEVQRQSELIEDLERDTEVWEENGRRWRRVAKEQKPQNRCKPIRGEGFEPKKGGRKAEKVEMGTQVDDLVYQCQWRPENMNVGCEDIFDSVQVCSIISVKFVSHFIA